MDSWLGEEPGTATRPVRIAVYISNDRPGLLAEITGAISSRNGNITKEGIKLDLEWMKRVGIGGFQNFDAALNTPKFVDKRLVYMTPEWKDAFRFTTWLADSLKLEMAIAGSPGWSESDGLWVLLRMT